MPFIPLEDFLMETFDEETRQEIEKELEKIQEESEKHFFEEQHKMPDHLYEDPLWRTE